MKLPVLLNKRDYSDKTPSTIFDSYRLLCLSVERWFMGTNHKNPFKLVQLVFFFSCKEAALELLKSLSVSKLIFIL